MAWMVRAGGPGTQNKEWKQVMRYSVQNIRNVCLLGHGGSGKTALAESLLYMTGAIDRMGKAADGNTVCDYDPEEIKRQISISLAVAPLEFKGCKINVLDTPGSFDFSGEVMEALRAADAAIIVCSAKDGISVGLEKAWKYCEERNMPRFIYISKTDEENADYNATFDALRAKYGNKIAPVVVPIWDEDKKIIGIIDVMNKRAYEMRDGKREEIEIPEELRDNLALFLRLERRVLSEYDPEIADLFDKILTAEIVANAGNPGSRAADESVDEQGVPTADEPTAVAFREVVDLIDSHPRNTTYVTETMLDPAFRESVAAFGVLQPVLVIPNDNAAGRYYLLAGHKRLLGSRLCGRSYIPAIIRKGLPPGLEGIYITDTNLQYGVQNMLPSEKCRTLWEQHQSLKEFGNTVGHMLKKNRRSN